MIRFGFKFFQLICNGNSTMRVACMDTVNLYREAMYKRFYYISLIKAGLYSPFRRSSFLHVKINYIRNVTVNVGQSCFVKGSFLPIKNNLLSFMNLKNLFALLQVYFTQFLLLRLCYIIVIITSKCAVGSTNRAWCVM